MSFGQSDGCFQELNVSPLVGLGAEGRVEKNSVEFAGDRRIRSVALYHVYAIFFDLIKVPLRYFDGICVNFKAVIKKDINVG